MSELSSMSNVTLRPWPAQEKEALGKEEVHAKLTQLTNERGYLRGITEKSLQDEVDAGKHVSEDFKEGVGHGQKKEMQKSASQDTIEELQRARVEMISLLEWAQFSAGNAMDLISLILSQDRNKKLDSSFSAGFKQQHVPMGSFGCHISKTVPPPHTDPNAFAQTVQDKERRQELVMRGSRMEALDSATDNLLKAATHLEKEVRKETNYWNELLSISQKGHNIQRLKGRQASRAPFGVRFGLPETSDHFKARGFAPLSMDNDGSIILDSALKLKPKTLRVRINDEESTVGSSHLPIQGDLSQVGVERSIQLARESLFEEELFHEMSLETRMYLAHGAELRNGVIHVLIPALGGQPKPRKLLIDCIPRDNTAMGAQDDSEDWLAENVAEGLRLLLAHEHQMRLQRRSQLPPALTAKKQQQPSPPLLRTLITMFHHLHAVDSLHAHLHALKQLLCNAGLNVSLDASRETSLTKLTEMVRASSASDLSAMDQLFEIFTMPLNGLATLSLPSSAALHASSKPEQLTVATRTSLNPPSLGTEHRVTLPPSLANALRLPKNIFKFSSTDDVKSYLDWIVELDLVHGLLAGLYGERCRVANQRPSAAIAAKGGKRSLKPERSVEISIKDAILRVDVRTGRGDLVESWACDGLTQRGSGRESFQDLVKRHVG